MRPMKNILQSKISRHYWNVNGNESLRFILENMRWIIVSPQRGSSVQRCFICWRVVQRLADVELRNLICVYRKLSHNQTDRGTGISEETSRLSARSSWGTRARPGSCLQLARCVCVCVCVLYLGTAVRMASGTGLKLSDPKLLLLCIRSWKDTHNKTLMFSTLRRWQLLTPDKR